MAPMKSNDFTVYYPFNIRIIPEIDPDVSIDCFLGQGYTGRDGLIPIHSWLP